MKPRQGLSAIDMSEILRWMTVITIERLSPHFGEDHPVDPYFRRMGHQLVAHWDDIESSFVRTVMASLERMGSGALRIEEILDLQGVTPRQRILIPREPEVAACLTQSLSQGAILQDPTRFATVMRWAFLMFGFSYAKMADGDEHKPATITDLRKILLDEPHAVLPCQLTDASVCGLAIELGMWPDWFAEHIDTMTECPSDEESAGGH